MVEVSFGEWLKRRRNAVGLTQEQLALQINCSTSALRKFESEQRRPSAEVVEQLANFFNIPQEERKSLLRFSRGDWQAISSGDMEEEPWRVSRIAPRSNLPTSTTSFIGREKEQSEIKSLIAKNRLVTLIGAGGIGKTRLSIQIASALLVHFPNGVWLVELASLSDPALVPRAVVNTLGLIDEADRPPLTVLSDFLRDKHILLSLDNCEHLIQACAQLAETLLHSCPNLHILATSREALEIPGEMLYRVPSLITPDLLNITFDSLPQYEAVQLFVERAQSALRDFFLTRDNAQAIAQICYHLDGIPLALELAAARVKVLSVEEIAMWLNDRFHLLTGGARTAMPRHQTLQALIDWSHNLLTEPERVLLRRLSVFAGGWTLEAVESICEDEGIEKREILDLLTQLVNKSLILAERKQGQKTRYRMLETIRQYSRDKLWAAGEGERMRKRHLAYFVELSERAEPNLRAFDMVEWLDRLETEHDNIRAALAWGIESDIEAELRLASALWWFWHIRDHKNEGTEWLERALSIETMERGNRTLTLGRAIIRGKALYVAGFLRLMFWETETAAVLSQESLALFRELGPAGKQGMAYALLNLGMVAGQQPDSDFRLRNALFEEGLAYFQEVGDKFGMAQALGDDDDPNTAPADRRALTQKGLALRKEIGDKDGIAISLIVLGDLASQQGDYKEAITLCEEGVTLFREVGNKWGIGAGLNAVGRAAYAQGNYGYATTVLEEALAFARSSGNKFLVARGLNYLGEVAAAQGDYEKAVKQYEEGVVIGQQIGNTGHIASGICGLGKVAWAQGNYQQATKRFEEAQAVSQQAEDKFGMLPGLTGLGRVAQSQGDYTSARARYTDGIMIYRERVLPSWEIEGVAYHLESLATLAVAQQQPERAAKLFGMTETLHAGIRLQMSVAERDEHDQAIAAARAALGEDAFTAAWEAGQKMSMGQAVALALNEH